MVYPRLFLLPFSLPVIMDLSDLVSVGAMRFCRYIPTGVLFDLLCAEPERPWNLTVWNLWPIVNQASVPFQDL